ncbi:hypothetical protein [Helicobacter sp. MIT 99-5507]|uniref:hypothetical protein n=1 Tax=Helicobacter sp. MIT 99-5507 TaxID=152489 RepID=UPI000E1EBA28|nr:hypothetical protein [Helicobacter sp. MIT 99-5507]RDU58116.1 hypothetical protein CQA42_04235 [Helicobacter sp. MIT 99-5507]
MKKILFSILFVFGLVSSSFGVDKMYGQGQGFLGAEVGFGGTTDFSVGVIGGYQHYFKESWQFAGFRHGVRGIGNISFGRYGGGFYNTDYNLMAIGAGADWTIEFTPNSIYNWGAFAGLGLVYINALNKDGWYPLNSIYLDGHIGGSLNIANTHRVEVAIGSGLSVVSLRYMYMF